MDDRRDATVEALLTTNPEVRSDPGGTERLRAAARITASQLATDMLEREQRFVRAAFGYMRELVIVCDPQGNVILVNRAMESFAGLEPIGLLSQPISAYYALSDPDGTAVASGQSPMERALRGDVVHDMEMVVTSRTGQSRRMVASGERLSGPDGTALGAIVVWRDITEQRAAEDRLAFHALHDAPAGRTPEHDPDTLILEAVTAMRRSTTGGSGRREPFVPEMRAAIRARFADEEALGRALAANQFWIAYQPKVSLITERTVGVEALLRWNHPERGLISPLDFIPLAEESGLIVPIGAWVLTQVCSDAMRWQTSLPGGRPLMVAVNVSPRQFESGLAKSFGTIIDAAGIDPRSVCLEVTESMVMQDAEMAITMLRELKSLGLNISVDDFGTGFSSLAYLKRFPLDELKIDKSFVDGLGRDPEATAIVAAIMGMAHALELRVVAEGVETSGQASRLRMLGCDEAQGFFFARPGTADDIDARLRSDSPTRAGVAGRASIDTTKGTQIKRVLVVDDADDVRQLARSSLAAVGMEVQEAPNGESAIAMTRHFRPDCVVLDVNLPGISGFDVCRLLRDDPQNKAMTIVILTGGAEPAEKVMAFSLKADDYMVKPFSPRDLVSRVNAAMRRRLEMLAHTNE